MPPVTGVCDFGHVGERTRRIFNGMLTRIITIPTQAELERNTRHHSKAGGIRLQSLAERRLYRHAVE
jgi:hypothetical protein